MCQQDYTLKGVESKLKGQPLMKLKQSLAKNEDLETFTDEKQSYDHRYDCKFAPLTTVDVERSFSVYKSILADNRRNSTETTIEYFNAVKYNQFLFVKE